MARVTPGLVVHPRKEHDEGVQGYPSSKPHLLLPWGGFRADVFSGVATAHNCGFSVTVCRNQWVAHKTHNWGLSFASAASPFQFSMPLLHTEAFDCRLTWLLRVSMGGGPLPGFLLGRAPAGHNLTHVCSPSYVSGQPKAPNYRYKRLHMGNTTVTEHESFLKAITLLLLWERGLST